DKDVVCVVEEPLDVLAIDRTGQYRGLYHVLHGAISPVNGVRPDDLKIPQLADRLKKGSIEELILATNPNLEGDATAMYIGQLISGNGVRVTRLARGLPMGGDLEWADEVTVSRALEGRRGLKGDGQGPAFRTAGRPARGARERSCGLRSVDRAPSSWYDHVP